MHKHHFLVAVVPHNLPLVNRKLHFLAVHKLNNLLCRNNHHCLVDNHQPLHNLNHHYLEDKHKLSNNNLACLEQANHNSNKQACLEEDRALRHKLLQAFLVELEPNQEHKLDLYLVIQLNYNRNQVFWVKVSNSRVSFKVPIICLQEVLCSITVSLQTMYCSNKCVSVIPLF